MVLSNHHRLCIALWLCWCSYTAHTQATNQPYDSIGQMMQQADHMQEEILDKNEDPQVTFRTFSHDTMLSIRQQQEFAYMQYIDSVLRARNTAATAQQPQTTLTEPNAQWWRALLWIFAMGALLFVLYQVFWRRSAFANPSTAAEEPGSMAAEQPGVDQREWLIANAIRQKNYREAIRYLFIDALHEMASRGHLHLMADKTNHQYLSEMEDHQLRSAFATLVSHFEYTWYGEFNPSEKQFESILKQFQQFRAAWL